MNEDDESTLPEFLGERVIATRRVHHMEFPSDMDVPAPAVMLDCPECAIACIIMPTFVRDGLHIEIHTFVDDERVDAVVTRPDGHGAIELMLRRPN